MPRHNTWWSALDGIKRWRREWIALTCALAELEDLRENDLGCIAPDGTMPPAGRHRVVASHAAAIELLLIRMESLDLDSGEVKRIAPTTFCKLADTCMNCEFKARCERDLAYDSAGMVTQKWENYCPNAATLKAMSALPWFGRVIEAQRIT